MKLKVLQGFRIDAAALDRYAAQVEAARAAVQPGEYKPSRQPAWLANGAVYIPGDVIEVGPVEAAELRVIAPAGALEAAS